MSLLRAARLSSSITLLGLALCPILLKAQQEPYGLFTKYSFADETPQNLVWTLCGRTVNSNGCFAGGALGPFGKADALIEGNVSVIDANTITHPLYIVDTEAGAGTDVVLHVYKATTIVNDPSSSTVTLMSTVRLPLTGGSSAICSMAGNQNFLYIGTNQTKHAVRVRKSDLIVTNAGEWGLGAKVNSMSSDKRGYIAINFGWTGGSGTIEYAPNGYVLGYSGPEFQFMLNTNIAINVEGLLPE